MEKYKIVIASETKQSYSLDEIATSRTPSNDKIVTFNTTPQPAFNKQFNLLIDNLNANHDKGYTNYIACVSEQQAKRFHDIFEDSHLHLKQYKTITLSLHQGFIDHDQKIVCYTDRCIEFDVFNILYNREEAIFRAENIELSKGLN